MFLNKNFFLRKSIFLMFFYICFLISANSLFANSNSDTQIINSSSSLYDDFELLCTMTKQAFFIENKPISIGEFKFYLRKIEYESLNESAKILYEKIKSTLNKKEDFFPEEETRLFVNPIVNPEVYYRTNSDVEYSFNRYLSGYPLEFDIFLGFSNYFTIESDLFIGKNYPETHAKYSFTNIPFSGDEIEFNFPKFAYGSTGATFENWGVNFHVGKEGVQIGNTKLGSIIYNNTFETDFYSQLNLYTTKLKYLMTVGQVQPEKYLYLHQIEMAPFSNFKISVIEGSLLNSNFELRYLNPFMIMHSFGSWYDYKYKNPELYDIYGEQNFCAYLAFLLEWKPIRNLRLYGLYSQNEILDFGGSRSDSALSVPDSIGGQFGINYVLTLSNYAILDTTLEAVYTSPFLYVKQSPDWSLYRLRDDVQSGENVESWIGSPFGPNTFAVTFYSEYKSNKKWNVGFGYLFKIHGENPLKGVEKVIVDNEGRTPDENGYYTYYPSVEYKLGTTEEEKKSAKNKGRNMWMQGIKEYCNMIYVDGNFDLTSNITLNGKVACVYIKNNKNIEDKNDFSVEFALGCKWKLF